MTCARANSRTMGVQGRRHILGVGPRCLFGSALDVARRPERTCAADRHECKTSSASREGKAGNVGCSRQHLVSVLKAILKPRQSATLSVLNPDDSAMVGGRHANSATASALYAGLTDALVFS